MLKAVRIANMFGSRSGSPYPGATGLLTSGNASAGPGGPLSTAGNVPPPSGGMPQTSVYNRTLDNEPNVVPSQLMFPSSHPDLKGEENTIREGDFVFVIRDLQSGVLGSQSSDSYGETFRSKQPRLSKDEVPLVTVQKLNQLLRSIAKSESAEAPPSPEIVKIDGRNEMNEDDSVLRLKTTKWWQDPELVAQWAVPFGAALNSIQLNRFGGGGDADNRRNRENWQAHNIVVSRKANVKNNFFTIRTRKGEKWHSQSCQRVGVQYTLEHVQFLENADPIPVVQVCFLLLDEPASIQAPRMLNGYVNLIGGLEDCASRRVLEFEDQDRFLRDQSEVVSKKLTSLEPIVIDSTRAFPRIDETSFERFDKKPLGDPVSRVIIQIGRVLHSAPRQPSAYECLNSCFNKRVYDGLKPIEIELGCP